MLAIKNIAFKDLNSILRSMKGGSLVFSFLLFMGLFFFNYVDSFAALQKNAFSAGTTPPMISQLLMTWFSVLHFVLILIIPSLTMGLFSEDLNNRTFRLLLKAPIYSYEIVLGKFLACLIMMSVILFLSLVFPLFLGFHGNPDWGLVF